MTALLHHNGLVDFLEPRAGSHAASELELVALGKQGPELLDSVAFGKGKVPSATEVAQRLEARATEYAAASPGAARFVVRALGPKGRLLAQYFFGYAAPPAETVDPTPRGLVRAFMGHSERLQALLLKNLDVSVGRLSVALDQAHDRIEKLEGAHLRTLEVLEDLMDRRVERDLEIATAAAREKRKDRLVSKFEGLAPILAARIAGVGPLSEFFKTLKPEQIASIVGALDENQISQLRALGELAACGDQGIGALLGIAEEGGADATR